MEGQKRGILVVVDCLDYLFGPEQDSKGLALAERYLGLVEGGQYDVCFASPSCGTWSAARHWQPGPRVLRTRDQPWGVGELVPGDDRNCAEGSWLNLFTLILLRAMVRVGGIIGLEHPKNRGSQPFASIWNLPDVQRLEATQPSYNVVPKACTRVNLDQCMFGAPSKKPTTILTSAPPTPRLLASTCTHIGKHAGALDAPRQGGVHPTVKSEEYPGSLPRAGGSTS